MASSMALREAFTRASRDEVFRLRFLNSPEVMILLASRSMMSPGGDDLVGLQEHDVHPGVELEDHPDVLPELEGLGVPSALDIRPEARREVTLGVLEGGVPGPLEDPEGRVGVLPGLEVRVLRKSSMILGRRLEGVLRGPREGHSRARRVVRYGS